MAPPPIRLLMLSLDQGVLHHHTQGDTLARFSRYQESCQFFSVIVPTTLSNSIPNTTPFPVIPSYGPNPLLAYSRLLPHIFSFCRKHRINLIVTNDLSLAAIACFARLFLSNKPVVQANVFGFEIASPQWMKQRPHNILFKWIDTWAITHTDYFRTDNTTDRNKLIHQFHIKPDQVITIPITPTPATQNKFIRSRKNSRLKRQIAGSNRLVLSVGNLVKPKDYPTLFRAIALLKSDHPHLTFAIAGEGPQRLHLEKLIHQLHIASHVNLLGSVSHAQLPTLFHSADLFVLCSEHEGMPRVIMEAVLSQTPIVTTSVGGITNLLTPSYSAEFVPIRDPAALAKAIHHLLTHKRLQHLYTQRAFDRVTTFLDFPINLRLLTNSWRQAVASL